MENLEFLTVIYRIVIAIIVAAWRMHFMINASDVTLKNIEKVKNRAFIAGVVLAGVSYFFLTLMQHTILE